MSAPSAGVSLVTTNWSTSLIEVTTIRDYGGTRVEGRAPGVIRANPCERHGGGCSIDRLNIFAPFVNGGVVVERSHDRFCTGFRGADFGPMKISGMMNGGPEVTLIIGVTSVARKGKKKKGERDDRLLAVLILTNEKSLLGLLSSSERIYIYI